MSMLLKLSENSANFDWLKTNVDSCPMFQFLYWKVTSMKAISDKNSKGGPIIFFFEKRISIQIGSPN